MKKPLGHVTVWQMTEQERLDYIKRHPIVPTKRPAGASFSEGAIDKPLYSERRKESLKKQGKLVVDNLDKLEALFKAGKSIIEIAEELNLTPKQASNAITNARKKYPERFPLRVKKRGL